MPLSVGPTTVLIPNPLDIFATSVGPTSVVIPAGTPGPTIGPTVVFIVTLGAKGNNTIQFSQSATLSFEYNKTSSNTVEFSQSAAQTTIAGIEVTAANTIEFSQSAAQNTYSTIEVTTANTISFSASVADETINIVTASNTVQFNIATDKIGTTLFPTGTTDLELGVATQKIGTTLFPTGTTDLKLSAESLMRKIRALEAEQSNFTIIEYPTDSGKTEAELLNRISTLRISNISTQPIRIGLIKSIDISPGPIIVTPGDSILVAEANIDQKQLRNLLDKKLIIVAYSDGRAR